MSNLLQLVTLLQFVALLPPATVCATHSPLEDALGKLEVESAAAALKTGKHNVIIFDASETPFAKVTDEFLTNNFGTTKMQLTKLCKELTDVLRNKLLKIHNLNLIPLNDDSSQCVSQDQCSLHSCSESDSERCLKIFEKSNCSKSHGCHLDLKGCSFFDLSLPQNEEANTNYVGHSAASAWKKLYGALTDLQFSNGLLSTFLSGVQFNVNTHICKNSSYNNETMTYTENLGEYFQRFVPKYGRSHREQHFSNFLVYFFTYHNAIVKYFEQPDIEKAIVEQFLLSDATELKLLKQSIEIISNMPKFSLSKSLVDPMEIGKNIEDMKSVFGEAIQLIQDHVECTKCQLYGTIQFLGLDSILEITAETPSTASVDDYSRLSGLLCPRQVVSMLQSYSRMTQALLYHIEMSQRECDSTIETDLLKCEVKGSAQIGDDL